MKFVNRTAIGLATLLLSAAAVPAFAGTVTVQIQNATTTPVTITGGGGTIPGSAAAGSTVQGQVTTTSGLPQQGVLTVKNAANTKACSFDWSRQGQAQVGGPLCNNTYNPTGIPLNVTTQCTGMHVSGTITPSPTCNGTIKFKIQ